MNRNNSLRLLARITLGIALLLHGLSSPAQGFILETPFSQDALNGTPLPEYPRPQMVRDGWINLNGEWDYRIEPCGFTEVQGLTDRSSWTDRAIPKQWDGKIRVPFAVDSPLSGVGHVLRPQEVIWYERSFQTPKDWKGSRVILHFQASDWETSVYVNGHRIGQHRGGYDPFSFDITDVVKPGRTSTIDVCAWDATEQQSQALGKQIMPEHRKGFRYQPTGGIWQTVWLERVPEASIGSIDLTPLYDESSVQIELNRSAAADGARVKIEIMDGGRKVAETTSRENLCTITVPDFKPWSPDSPFLYDVVLTVLDDKGNALDRVASYFGMRKIEILDDARGFKRTYLNGKEVFQFGPLDQGYWPDGVLTPPTDEAMAFDLQYLKNIGANMVRVHIKTHPDRWYYHADRLGILVWQDMICMPKYDQTVTPEASEQWMKEFKSMQGWLRSHPSIVTWIVFNEAWGQHDTERITAEVMSWDKTRPVTCASGWNDAPAGNIIDVHDYSFYPKTKPDAKTGGSRASVIGEAGGTNLAIPGHTWYSDKHQPEQEGHRNYEPKAHYEFIAEGGRHTYADATQYEEAYGKYIRTLRWLRSEGGCNATVHTQITDVEHELNGWMTYDRKVSKIPVSALRKLHLSLYEPLNTKVIIPWGDIWADTSGSEFSRLPGKSATTIINAFFVDDMSAAYCVGVFGVNNYEILLNGQLFRRVNTGQDTEPSYQFFEVFPDEAGKYLREGMNKIEVKVIPMRNGRDSFDIAVFKATN